MTPAYMNLYQTGELEARAHQAVAALAECRLCPRDCAVDRLRDERSVCWTGRYAQVASSFAHFGEEDCLRGTRGSGTIFLAKSNLRCVFCQNFEISQAAPEEIRRHKVSPEKMVALTLAKGCQGIAYTYTEPTIFYEYMLDIATLAKAKGIRNYWITCGQIEEAPLVELCKVMDAANVDLKGFSDDFYVEYCNAHLFPVLRTLKILRREEVFFEITNLLVPEANDSPEMIEDMCRWIVAELGADTPVHFSRFHPDYKLTKRPPTPIETLLMARDVAQKAGLKYVYIGNVRDPKGGTTTCPVCAKSLIRRMGYVVAYNRVKDGRCEHCGAPITGIWK